MRPAPGSSIEAPAFEYAGSELASLHEAENYYRWLLSHFQPFLGERVVEVGAGIGNFAELVLRHVPVKGMTLVEPAANLFPALRERFAQDSRVRLLNGRLESFAGTLTADSVVMVNVLEHVEDDDSLLRAIRQVLLPRGTLLLFVPALPWLFGSLDRAFEHFRRYTKAALAEKLRHAGFRIERLRYFNLPGVASWLLAGRILRRTTLRSNDVCLYDRLVVPWCSRLERVWEPPIGQSLVAVGRK